VHLLPLAGHDMNGAPDRSQPQGLFCRCKNRDARSRRVPSHLVLPCGQELPAHRPLAGHPSPTRFACRENSIQFGGVVRVWVAVSTYRITSFSPSRSAHPRGERWRPAVVFEP
jgi:hypothetical protein